MNPPGSCCIVTLTALLVATTARAQIPEPDDAPPPRTPEESAAAFQLPDGFRMEVVASEPLISSPSGICFDERGRLFVSELHGYNLEGQLDIEELNKTGKLDTQVRRVQAEDRFKEAAEAGTFGVVKLLRDTDGDGRMDEADVWADDLPAAYGLVPAQGGVIVCCAPKIVLLADRDGDGIPEVRETLFTGLPADLLERRVNAPQWNVDGWIYFGRGRGGARVTGPHLAEPVTLTDSDFRIRADGRAIEPLTGGTHTFGFAVTDSAERFVMSTTTPGICVAPLPWRYLIRNPDAAVSGLEEATGDRRAYPLAPPHPWRQRRADHPEYFEYYKSRYGAAESEAGGWFTSACSPLIYRDHALPGLHGHYFVCEPSGNILHRSVIHRNGPALELHRAAGEDTSEFAASRDPWCHPMNLFHGPEGALWIVDYYREIIEDYSAIPRHLQQQYGLYNGHERGRIYRLTHDEMPTAPPSDMSGLDVTALARDVAGSLFWRRQTAHRLLVERGESSAAPELRAALNANDAAPASIITALHTLDGLRLLQTADVLPFFIHEDIAVRVHAWQLADRWFAADAGTLRAAIAAAQAESEPRVLLQVAMSLGEARDPQAFTMLATLARERLDVRWMDAAIMSSLHGRGTEMLAELLREPGMSQPLWEQLAASIAANGDEAQHVLALTYAATAPDDVRPALQAALANLRRGVAANTTDDDDAAHVATAPPMQVSEETFRRYTAALAGKRDLERGHAVFKQLCANCHRVGDEGHVFGPDLMGELGVAEETLVHHLLLPNERIRPGFETTLIERHDGLSTAGIQKEDGATSITLLAPAGIQQVILKKDIAATHRLQTSLMPSVAEGLTPADVANVLAWLRTQLRVPASKP